MNIGIVTMWSPLEIPYMKEWVEHHKSLGITQFIVALNDWSAFDMVQFRKCFWREMNDKTIHPFRIDGLVKQLPAMGIGA